MSISRDEWTRMTFVQHEVSPRPVAAITILTDYDETVCRGRYYGSADVITTAAEFLYNAGVALHGVTLLTPSQVGLDISASIDGGLPAFVVWPQPRLGAEVHVIEQISSSDVRPQRHPYRRVLTLSRRLVQWLELSCYIVSTFGGTYFELKDLVVWPKGQSPIDPDEEVVDDATR